MAIVNDTLLIGFYTLRCLTWENNCRSFLPLKLMGQNYRPLRKLKDHFKGTINFLSLFSVDMHGHTFSFCSHKLRKYKW